MDPIKVMIADDHPLIREGLVKVISLDPGLKVVGEAADGEELIEKAGQFLPDVILLDLNMPRLDGLAAARILREKHPGIRLIVLTVEDSEERVVEIIKSGVRGYMLKDIEPMALASAIRAVWSGETVIHPRISSIIIREMAQNPVSAQVSNYSAALPLNLTSREMQILRCIARGLHNREIARQLFLSEKTVKNHVTSIFKKLQVDDRTQAALAAIKQKIVDL